MNRKQATHHDLSLKPTGDTPGWLAFLSLWHERLGDSVVHAHDLVPSFWRAKMPFASLAISPRQTLSIINRLLWNGRGTKYGVFGFLRVGEDDTGRGLYRLHYLGNEPIHTIKPRKEVDG